MFANQSCATISFSRKKYIGSNLSEKITSQSLDLFCTTWLVFWKKSLLMMPSFSSANYDKCHNHTLQSISNPCHNNSDFRKHQSISEILLIARFAILQYFLYAPIFSKNSNMFSEVTVVWHRLEMDWSVWLWHLS